MPTAGTKVKAYNGPEQDTVSTFETTTSGTFTNLTTVGPSVTVYLEVGQSCMFIAEALCNVSVEGATGSLFAVEVAGPGTSDLAADGVNGCENGNIRWTPATKHVLFTATVAGDHTGTMKYRQIGTITAGFKERRLTAWPSPPP